ncbi:MAG: iron-containing alcohol dehydrogenase, partial [Planctomycetes bacterium]|nr:iron-containing alcohol dehydrogenase [Planctomycetota bacterium]
MPNKITRFSFPTTIVFGPGAVKQLPACLKEVGISRPLLVTDAGLKNIDVFSTVQQVLTSASVPFGVFADVHPNPLITDVEKAMEVYHAENCDGVIGLGGGS